MASSRILLIVGIILLASGCGLFQGRPATEAPPGTGSLPPSEAQLLRQELYRYADHFAATTTVLADEIAFRTRNREIQELSLRWKLRFIPAMQHAVLAADPRYALLDAWGLTVQIQEHNRQQRVRELLSDEDQQLLTGAATKLLERVEQIAKDHLDAESFAAAREEVVAFARENPASPRLAQVLVRASDHAATGSGIGLQSILAIPIGGLAEGADALARISRVAVVLAEIVQDLPERIRWQTEMLLLEIDSMESVRGILEEINLVSRGLDNASATAASLPERMRMELDAAVKSLEDSQGELRSTITETTRAFETLDSAFVTVGAGARDVSTAGDSLLSAAEAWKATTDSVGQVAAMIEKMGEDDTAGIGGARPADGDPPPAASDGLEIEDYTRAAEEVRRAAVELRALFEDLHSGRATTVFQAFEASSGASIDLANQRAEALLDRITYRGLLLIGAALAAMLIYRFLAGRRAPRGQRA
jgi:hypothetical protein